MSLIKRSSPVQNARAWWNTGKPSPEGAKKPSWIGITGVNLHPFEGQTDLFILPGFSYKVVDALVTNFHLPRSTLLMLVSAFAGRERILQNYQAAMENGYRFYSFGDAMLIL